MQAELSVLASLMHARTLLTAHGVSALRAHLRTHYEGEVKRYKRSLIGTHDWQRFVQFVDEAIAQVRVLVFPKQLRANPRRDIAQGGANPKIDRLVDILTDHFERVAEAERQTSVIVFAQFR